MRLKSDATHWGSLAKAFHWTIVLLLLAQGTLGLVMVNLPKKPGVIPYFTFHKSLGLTILLLAVLRLGWRLFDRRPEEPASMPHGQVIVARIGHAWSFVRPSSTGGCQPRTVWGRTGQHDRKWPVPLSFGLRARI